MYKLLSHPVTDEHRALIATIATWDNSQIEPPLDFDPHGDIALATLNKGVIDEEDLLRSKSYLAAVRGNKNTADGRPGKAVAETCFGVQATTPNPLTGEPNGGTTQGGVIVDLDITEAPLHETSHDVEAADEAWTREGLRSDAAPISLSPVQLSPEEKIRLKRLDAARYTLTRLQGQQKRLANETAQLKEEMQKEKAALNKELDQIVNLLQLRLLLEPAVKSMVSHPEREKILAYTKTKLPTPDTIAPLRRLTVLLATTSSDEQLRVILTTKHSLGDYIGKSTTMYPIVPFRTQEGEEKPAVSEAKIQGSTLSIELKAFLLKCIKRAPFDLTKSGIRPPQIREILKALEQEPDRDVKDLLMANIPSGTLKRALAEARKVDVELTNEDSITEILNQQKRDYYLLIAIQHKIHTLKAELSRRLGHVETERNERPLKALTAVEATMSQIQDISLVPFYPIRHTGFIEYQIAKAEKANRTLHTDPEKFFERAKQSDLFLGLNLVLTTLEHYQPEHLADLHALKAKFETYQIQLEEAQRLRSTSQNPIEIQTSAQTASDLLMEITREIQGRFTSTREAGIADVREIRQWLEATSTQLNGEVDHLHHLSTLMKHTGTKVGVGAHFEESLRRVEHLREQIDQNAHHESQLNRRISNATELVQSLQEPERQNGPQESTV